MSILHKTRFVFVIAQCFRPKKFVKAKINITGRATVTENSKRKRSSGHRLSARKECQVIELKKKGLRKNQYAWFGQ